MTSSAAYIYEPSTHRLHFCLCSPPSTSACLIMSKRAASTSAVRPTKLAKQDDVWSLIPLDNDKSKEFKPVEGGPKTKLMKTVVLNYNPRMEVSICLNGCHPELRFLNPDQCFIMTSEEFLDMSGPSLGLSAHRVRLEPTEEDNFRLARYVPTESGMLGLLPIATFNLNKFAAKRLKSKLDVICEHVSSLSESEPVIRLMFECVADAYRAEYKLLNTLVPISDKFDELSRVVETYVPAVIIVRSFLDKMYENRLISHYNHYNLCQLVIAQKSFLRELLQ